MSSKSPIISVPEMDSATAVAALQSGDSEVQDRNHVSPKILNSWKDIANYLGRGVRTVQRYESQFGLPVRRPAGRNRSSVVAFAQEIDAWLQGAPRKEKPSGNRLLLVFNAGKNSDQKMVVEAVRISVHNASSAQEICAIAEQADVDEVLVEMNPADEVSATVLRSMKHREARPLVFMSAKAGSPDQSAAMATSKLVEMDPAKLLNALKTAFGDAKAA